MAREIIVRPYDWITKDRLINNLVQTIHCWAHLYEPGKRYAEKPVLLRFDDYPASFIVEMPEVHERRADNTVGVKIWNSGMVHAFFIGLQNSLKDRAPYHYEFEQLEKLYYWSGKKRHPMMRLYFSEEHVCLQKPA